MNRRLEQLSALYSIRIAEYLTNTVLNSANKSLFSLLPSSLRNICQGEVITGRRSLLFSGAHFSCFILKADE